MAPPPIQPDIETSSADQVTEPLRPAESIVSRAPPKSIEAEPAPIVKKEAMDVKPEIAADGKVACMLCGLRVSKDNFKVHAKGAHAKSKPYICNLCPFKERTKVILSKHQKNEHNVAMSDDSITFTGSKDNLDEIVQTCFGSVENIDYARSRCVPCDKIINNKHVKLHISMYHLKKPLHR